MVDTLLAILEFILALSLLAFLHELGHFLTARMFKIEVQEFGLGYPPRAKKLFTWKGTEFTLNWIPFGAFVLPKGENDPDVPDGLGSAHPLKRLVVLLGGPVVNLVVGIILFAVLYTQTGAPDYTRVQVTGTSPNSPAAAAGFKAGDILSKINDTKVTDITQLSALVKAGAGSEVSVTYERNSQEFTVRTIPRTKPPENEGALGVFLSNPIIPIGFDRSFPLAFEMTGRYAWELLSLPGKLIQGTISPEQSRIVGPKGMFDIFNQARERDQETAAAPSTGAAVNVLAFIAILSVALGITNLLPLPALDGGRILFLIPELLFGKRVPPRYENTIHAVGFSLLLLLLAFVTLQDFINPIVMP